ncbi:MAG TPA: signal peptidase I [Nocardioides sp.]|nr:signal peptidase I [Nocardioides sp.]
MTTDDALGPDEESQGDEVESAPGPRPRHSHKKHLPVWQESILLLVIALGLAIVIKAFFVQAFYIPSASMEPGLIQNDRILVEKPSYWFAGSPQRGDVIVFSDPGNWLDPTEDAGPTGLASLLAKIGLYPTGGHLVKRVIGVPGDTIHCCNAQGELEINGKAVDESSFMKPGSTDPCDAALFEGTAKTGTKLAGRCDWTLGPVPAGKLFVLGDNRDNSADSRAHLCNPAEDPCTKSPWVPEDSVVGKVFALVWPKSRWSWIGRPEAFKDIPDAS